jgi:hypothetical protein
MPLWAVVVALVVAYHFVHDEGVRSGFAATGHAMPFPDVKLGPVSASFTSDTSCAAKGQIC